MRRSWSERGEGRFGCVIGLLILVGAIFVASKVIPVKVKSAELRQVIVDEAKSAGTRSNERIRRAVMAKARDLELPLTDKDLRIHRAAGEIKVEATYTVPVDFAGYVYQWEFNHKAQNPIF